MVSRIFLPAGYPSSVTGNFMQYSAWQFVNLTTGTMTGVLSMQALLFSVGVGSASVPLAAAINWVLKDGLGQVVISI